MSKQIIISTAAAALTAAGSIALSQIIRSFKNMKSNSTCDDNIENTLVENIQAGETSECNTVTEHESDMSTHLVFFCKSIVRLFTESHNGNITTLDSETEINWNISRSSYNVFIGGGQKVLDKFRQAVTPTQVSNMFQDSLTMQNFNIILGKLDSIFNMFGFRVPDLVKRAVIRGVKLAVNPDFVSLVLHPRHFNFNELIHIVMACNASELRLPHIAQRQYTDNENWNKLVDKFGCILCGDVLARPHAFPCGCSVCGVCLINLRDRCVPVNNDVTVYIHCPYCMTTKGFLYESAIYEQHYDCTIVKEVRDTVPIFCEEMTKWFLRRQQALNLRLLGICNGSIRSDSSSSSSTTMTVRHSI